jgi:hypothetical protein
MLEVIVRFLRWVFDKCAVATVIVALALVACALWLFLKDNVDFDEWRRDVVRAINGERTKVKEAMADVHKRMDRISAEISAEQERGKQADRVIAQLRELESTWDKLVGNREQQKSNAEQLAKMIELRLAVTEKVKNLQQEFTRATWERDGLEIALGKVEVRLKEAEEKQSRLLHYLQRAWEQPVGRGWATLPVEWWVYLTLGFYFLGPTVGALVLFYLVAPRIERGRPVQFEAVGDVLPDVGPHGVSAELMLRNGERLWVREQFLQASDEALAKKTRALLDWRMPLTCVATRLVELIEMRQTGGAEQRVTLAHQADPHRELAVLDLAEGASLVLRPSFLAGVVLPADGRLRVRRRWQIFRWQAWVTLQFRYFEFVGPCRLIVAGLRGVRVERLDERKDGTTPARRTNQDATIGFTPSLACRPARAESFWSYYRGMNPLFDDRFEGRGIFLCQQVAAPGQAAAGRRFWSGAWGGVLRVFGL